MAARRITYISFLVIVAAIASVSPNTNRDYTQAQQLIEQYLCVINEDAVEQNQQVPEKTEPAVHPFSNISSNLSSINIPVVFTGYLCDMRSEIARKNRILLE